MSVLAGTVAASLAAKRRQRAGHHHQRAGGAFGQHLLHRRAAVRHRRAQARAMVALRALSGDRRLPCRLGLLLITGGMEVVTRDRTSRCRPRAGRFCSRAIYAPQILVGALFALSIPFVGRWVPSLRGAAARVCRLRDCARHRAVRLRAGRDDAQCMVLAEPRRAVSVVADERDHQQRGRLVGDRA